MRFTPRPPQTTRAECSSAKVGYDTEREARESKDYNEKERGLELDVYQCRECLRWHLTSRK